MARVPIYDRIGRGYAEMRRPDPRIAAHIESVLTGATSVVNVGAGSGSYEPKGRRVVAVEPSDVMIAQRPPGSAPVVRAVAETLPFAPASFDVALAVLSVHHWSDPKRGLAELQRVAPRQVVLTWDPIVQARFWFVRDYLPEWTAYEATKAKLPEVLAMLPGARVETVLVPSDCADGFGCAYWRRPDAYLDPDVRASISVLSLLDADVTDRALGKLEADLESGAWHRRNAALLELDEYDGGYRLVVAENA
jgi:SAM-dependent methyltransferase